MFSWDDLRRKTGSDATATYEIDFTPKWRMLMQGTGRGPRQWVAEGSPSSEIVTANQQRRR
jgi:hypothetical protein